MSLPSAEPVSKREAHDSQTAGFYGRSYPRASVILDSSNAVKQDRKMPPPSSNAPLLEWASKAGWNKGGAHKADVGPKPPKQAFTPLYAFLASQQLKLKLLNPSLGTADLQALAKATVEEDWNKLPAETQEIYVKMAEDDAQRYEKEAAAFEQKYPGLLASRRAHRREVKPATGPRRPLKAFQIFAEEQIKEKLGDGAGKPRADYAKEQKKLVAELEEVWKEMTEEQQAPFEERAEGDLRRWESELEKFPELKAKVTSKAQARAAEARQKAEKREILQAAKGKKRGGRPARKRALSRPAAIVKNGALVRKSKGEADPEGGRVKRRRKAHKAAIVEEESEEDTDEEEEEPDLGQSDSGDDIPSEDEESDEEEPEEDQEAEEDDVEADAPGADDGDVEISDQEEELPAAATPLAETPNVKALAAVAAEEEEEDAEDALRALQATDPKSEASAGKGNIFGWATAALMSGFKGVWSGRKSMGTSSPLLRPQLALDAEAEALVDKTFKKDFDGQFYRGKVDKFLPENRWYAVSYEDGDSEEMTEAQLARLMRATDKRLAAGSQAKGQNKRKR